MGRGRGAGGPLLWILGGGAVLGMGALLASPGARQAAGEIVDDVSESAMTWVNKVIDRVSRHEGGYDALNLNTDGAGLSFGRIQWAQRPGSLGVLLKAMAQADPGRFQATFGPASEELLRVTATGSLGPVEGAVLWREPWVSRFRTAGRDGVFQAVQDKLMVEGEYFQAALAAARILGAVTERSMALLLDTAVQRGPGTARQLARRVVELYAGNTIPLKVMLETCARLDAQPFLRTSAPTAPPRTPGHAWKEVSPGEWHLHAGVVDLYTDILRRRLSIVQDPDLGDALLEASPTAKVA